MNEIPYRAPLAAGLSEEDVAAPAGRPEDRAALAGGRMPQPRHRWALAGLLGRERASCGPRCAPHVPPGAGARAARILSALALYWPLRPAGGVLIRLHRAVLYNSIYRGDDQLLVSRHACGMPGDAVPMLHLHVTDPDGMATMYLDSFEGVWASAVPWE